MSLRSMRTVLAACELIGIASLAIPGVAAQSVVEPPLAVTEQGARPLAAYPTLEKTMMEGHAQRLLMTYSASNTIEFLVTPFRTHTGYNPNDLLWATLPAGEELTLSLDLTGSPAWSPWTERTLLWGLAAQSGTTFAIHSVGPDHTRDRSLFYVALRQLFLQEPFQVSTIHTLDGSRVFNTSVAGMASIVMIGATVLFVVAGRFKKLHPRHIPLFLLITVLLLQGRTAVDLLRLSVAHLHEWKEERTYANLGSVRIVADVLRQEQRAHDETSLFVYVCSPDSDYYAKAMRYFAYPIAVTAQPRSSDRITHVLVRYDHSVSDALGTLSCGAFEGGVRLVQRFADGAALYSLLPAIPPTSR